MRPCNCRCPDDTPCVFLDEFDIVAERYWWQAATTTGGTAAAVNLTGGALSITGDGSATSQTTLPATPQTLYVAAELMTPAVGSAGGVTIRRADSPANLSLWWMGGTDYELRHGSTVLAAFTGSGDPTIKLELTTPGDPTTDVLCYVGGVLTHTEAAVAFTIPPRLNLGMIAENGAAFLWFESSPCPFGCRTAPCDTLCESAYSRSLCNMTGVPAGVEIPNIPATWSADIPEPTGTYGTSCCSRFGGDLVFLNREFVVEYFADQNTWIAPPSAAPEDPLYHCIWLGAIKSKWHGMEAADYSPHAAPAPLPSGTWPWWGAGNCDGQPNAPGPNTAVEIRWKIWIDQQGTGPTEADFDSRVVLELAHVTPGGGTVLAYYRSAWESWDLVDYVGAPTTVSLELTNPTLAGCTLPATITLTPNGDRAVAAAVTNCEEIDNPCDPPPGLPTAGQICLQIALVDEDDRSIEYAVELVPQWNASTATWEWIGLFNGWEHPTCGPIDQTAHTIRCAEPEEGEPRSWILEIETAAGIARLMLTSDIILGWHFAGHASNLCTGETWEAVGYGWGPTEPAVDIFGCDAPACVTQAWLLSGAGSCDMGNCAGESNIEILTATSSPPPGVAAIIGPAYHGPYPLSSFPGGLHVWLWEDTGGVHLAIYNGATLIETATPVSGNCTTGPWKFAISDPTFACCSGWGGGTLTLTRGANGPHIP